MEKIKLIGIKILKISGISIVVILLLMFLLPILFPKTITEKIKNFANEKIDGNLKFSEANLSFFNHFPSLTLTLNDFILKGSKPFLNDTLVSSREIAFGIGRYFSGARGCFGSGTDQKIRGMGARAGGPDPGTI